MNHFTGCPDNYHASTYLEINPLAANRSEAAWKGLLFAQCVARREVYSGLCRRQRAGQGQHLDSNTIGIGGLLGWRMKTKLNTGIRPPKPYAVQPSTLGPKLMLKSSLKEQYKSSSAYDLSLLRLKLDILYDRPKNSHSHLTHCLISAPNSSQIPWLTPWSPFPPFLPNPPSSAE